MTSVAARNAPLPRRARARRRRPLHRRRRRVPASAPGGVVRRRGPVVLCLLAAGALSSPAAGAKAPAVAAAAAAAIPASAAAAPTPAGGGRAAGAPLRRVVLISCDALSASHLRAYARSTGRAGGPGPGGWSGTAAGAGGPAAAGSAAFPPAHTAFFDSLTGEGVLFRRCLAPQGWTLTSHFTMLTGLLPGAHRVGAERPLAAGVPLLTETLRTAGFATGFFPNGNTWLLPTFGYDRGADLYRQFPITGRQVAEVAAWCDGRLGPVAGRAGGLKPFFLFVHFMDAHSRSTKEPFPYWPVPMTHQFALQRSRRPWPPPRFLPEAPPGTAGGGVGALGDLGDLGDLGEEVRQWDLAGYDPALLRHAYDACVTAWDDDRLRRLLRRLERAGHLRETLLIVTADHGEEFGEHGGFLHRQPYAEVREVPLLLIWPGRLPRGAAVEAPVGLVDLAPTILDLAGLPPLPRTQGMSLRPLLEDPGARLPARDFLIDGHFRGYRRELSALVGEAEGRLWSLVAEIDTTGCAGTFQPERVGAVRGLYDLAADPGERRDLAAAHPAVAADLAARMQQQYAAGARLAQAVAGAAGPAALTAEQKRQLRALGY